MPYRLEQLLANILSLPEGKITDQTGPDNLSAWDSFNGLRILEGIEKNFQVKIDISDMIGIKNVADIKVVLKKHGVKINN